VFGGVGELVLRLARRDVRGGVEDGEVLSDDLLGGCSP
jgi:hypothetical protein